MSSSCVELLKKATFTCVQTNNTVVITYTITDVSDEQKQTLIHEMSKLCVNLNAADSANDTNDTNDNADEEVDELINRLRHEESDYYYILCKDIPKHSKDVFVEHLLSSGYEYRNKVSLSVGKRGYKLFKQHEEDDYEDVPDSVYECVNELLDNAHETRDFYYILCKDLPKDIPKNNRDVIVQQLLSYGYEYRTTISSAIKKRGYKLVKGDDEKCTTTDSDDSVKESVANIINTVINNVKHETNNYYYVLCKDIPKTQRELFIKHLLSDGYEYKSRISKSVSKRGYMLTKPLGERVVIGEWFDRVCKVD